MIRTITSSDFEKISDLLQMISPKPRLEILMVIGSGEACVCHLEAILGYRQAYISQHLMALREAGVLDTRRDGKFIYYHLEKPDLLDIVKSTARLAGLDLSADIARINDLHEPCECPRCNPGKE
jgi:ArsR family transcriptional regulator